MTQTAAADVVPDDVEAVTARAAHRAGIEVRELHDLADMQGASELFDAVWTDPSNTIMPTNLVRALSSAGSYVAGAFSNGTMVGAILGFVGLHDGDVVVHSHILGVLADARGRSVGFALKQHQRAWCLARGIDTVLWTFDPLVRRNAYFNLSKLGAFAARYEVNFYGEMSDGINAGDETDRLVVSWNLEDVRVAAAARGEAAAPPPAGGILLDVASDGSPVSFESDDAVLRCRVPEDILRLRAEQPDLALRWRHALRQTLGDALNRGYVASDMDRAGWYTLTRTSGG